MEVAPSVFPFLNGFHAKPDEGIGPPIVMPIGMAFSLANLI